MASLASARRYTKHAGQPARPAGDDTFLDTGYTPPTLTNKSIESAIEGEFLTDSTVSYADIDVHVDQDDVKVEVADGIANLTGTVDSWGEYEAATDNAFEGGAVWVANDLVVKSSHPAR